MANDTSNSMLIAVIAVIAIVVLAFFVFRYLPNARNNNDNVIPDVNVDINDTTPNE